MSNSTVEGCPTAQLGDVQLCCWSSPSIYYKKRLKIGFDGKEELVDEYALEGCDIVLFIEHQHSFFIIDGVHCAE